MSTLPVEILTLANQGAKLFPLRPNDKVPIMEHWQDENNSSDPARLEFWGHRFPGCNWAMRCGEISHAFALDFDCKNGKPGMDVYQRMLEEHGPEWIDTIRVRTWSGGLHLWYVWVRGIGKKTDGLAYGVDIQGEISYVVVPPSIVNGKAYYFEDCDAEKTIAPVPSWLLPDILKAFKTETLPPPPPQSAGKIQSGQRHQFLLHHAGQLLHVGIGLKALTAELLELNYAKFAEPYPQDEIFRQVNDFYQRWQRDPRDIWREFNQERKKQPMPGTYQVQEQRLEEVDAMPVEWLEGWMPYIALGTLTMLTGDPGVGKSFIALAIMAQLTRLGINVAYMSIENPAAYVVRPRFDALGGDPSRMILIKGLETPEGRRNIALQDLVALASVIQKHNVKLIVIDPIQSYLGAHVDQYRSNETRPVLDGLMDLAEVNEVAILILRHVVKAGGNRAIHKGLGSIDFTGAVRSELFAGETLDKQKAMCHIKSNLGPLGKSQSYQISEMDDSGRVWQAGYFRWTGECELKVSDLTEPESAKNDESALREAEEWLSQLLAGGARLQADIQVEAKDNGISLRTLRRAKKKLHVKSMKRVDKKWQWYLPGHDASGQAAS